MGNVSANFLTSEERLSLVKSHKKEKDGRRRDRLKFVVLLNDGWSYSQISRALLIDDQTLRNYWTNYERGGLKVLLSFEYKGCPSKLSESEQKALELYLSENTYITSYQIGQYIKETYGKEYSKTGVIALLQKLGFVYKKAKVVPGNPDPEKQKEFVKQYEDLRTSLPEDEEILFMDGAHPTHNVKASTDGSRLIVEST